MQAYLYLGSEVDDVVDSLGLDGMAAERVRFALMLAREAMAPTNYLLDQPRGGQALSTTPAASASGAGPST